MRSVTAAISLFAVLGTAVSAPADAPRPRLEVAAPSVGCPSVSGAFVVLLDPHRGMLLLSADSFPGSLKVGHTSAEPLTVSASGEGSWQLARANTPDPSPLWAAPIHPLAAGGRGCVAFDRDGFASEGDLASYVHWLVERVYLELPAGARERWPAFTLDGRSVRVRVTQGDARPLERSAREGGTLAFRTTDGGILMLQPFVLDEASGTVTLGATMTSGNPDDGVPPHRLGWFVASTAEPTTLTEPAVTIAVVSVTPP